MSRRPRRTPGQGSELQVKLHRVEVVASEAPYVPGDMFIRVRAYEHQEDGDPSPHENREQQQSLVLAVRTRSSLPRICKPRIVRKSVVGEAVEEGEHVGALVLRQLEAADETALEQVGAPDPGVRTIDFVLYHLQVINAGA